MQERYSPIITQSLFENVCNSHFFFGHKNFLFLTLPRSVSAVATQCDGRFVQSSSLFKTLCKHSMHIHTVNILYIYLSIIFIYIEQDFLRVMAVLSHTRTHILSRRQNIGHETTALLVTFLLFFFLFCF